MLLSGIESGIFFRNIHIQKDIEITGEIKLKADEVFNVAWFYFDQEIFSFILWNRDPETNRDNIIKKKVDIAQKDLVPYLKW